MEGKITLRGQSTFQLITFTLTLKERQKTLNKLDYQNIFVLGFTPFLTSNDGIILIFSTEI